MPRIASLLTLLLMVTSCMCNMQPVDLGAAVNFTVLAAAGVTNSGPTTVGGYLGVSPAAITSITGSAQISFSSLPVVQLPHIAVEPVAAKAAIDVAYLDAAGRVNATLLAAVSLSGLTLTPGLYKRNGALALDAGDFTLSGKGVYIFQIATTLLVTTGRKMILADGAEAKDVFWQVGTSAAFQGNSKVVGTVLASTTIALVAGATVEGRLFSVGGQVTLLTNTISYPFTQGELVEAASAATQQATEALQHLSSLMA
jgi:hypothetical protein